MALDKQKIKNWIDTAIEVSCELAGERAIGNAVQLVMPVDIVESLESLGLAERCQNGSFVYRYNISAHYWDLIRIWPTDKKDHSMTMSIKIIK
jgi:hypothetical protein